jgi:hypothetical protein
MYDLTALVSILVFLMFCCSGWGCYVRVKRKERKISKFVKERTAEVDVHVNTLQKSKPTIGPTITNDTHWITNKASVFIENGTINAKAIKPISHRPKQLTPSPSVIGSTQKKKKHDDENFDFEA